jgi:hypothetical protein
LFSLTYLRGKKKKKSKGHESKRGPLRMWKEKMGKWEGEKR